MRNKDKRIKRDQPYIDLIRYYFEKSRRKAGIVTIDMMIRNSSHEPINHKKIARIKREYGIITKIRRRNPYKNLPTSEHVNIPNILQRDFVNPTPDHAYSTDMTYLFYGKGERAYLSATKDLATNEIVSYQLMKTPRVEHFKEEFRRLITSLPEQVRKSLIIHSDQGFQYTHKGFRRLLKSYGVTQSMSRRGNCLDNAPIESFFGHFKDMLEIKKCKRFEDLKDEVDGAIHYYNNERPQKALNKKPPAQYRGLISCFF